MTPTLWASVIIFFSAYSPLALIFVIKDFNFITNKLEHPHVSFVILGFALLSVLFLWFVIRTIKKGFYITIEEAGNRSNELLNYTLPYIVSFLEIDLGKPQDVIAFCLFMLLLCFLSIKTNIIFLNPVLALFGYRLYDVKFKENDIPKKGNFLSKQELLIGSQYKIRKIYDFLYIVTELIEHKETEDDENT
ncbi:MAG: hypothetical protein QY310_14370 [Candidatus Jettenia sp. CY-1]|nr:hypothetical protein [Candidatus Jettenia sp.]WKZ18595.1 MAG: hypothetical protein QY310_14370 [Candidatus Jettenia sp. CY-1]